MTSTLLAMPLRPRLIGPEAPLSVAFVPGHLHVALTVDDGAGPRPVTEADLTAWGTTVEQLLPMAINRLRRESRINDWQPIDTVPGMSTLVTGDGAAAARMLCISDLVGDWPLGGIIVVAPTPDQLLAVALHDVSDIEALNVMISAAQFAHMGAEEPLSNQAFWTDGHGWEHVAIRHCESEVDVSLPDALRDRLGHLAAMGMVAIAGEA